MSRQGPEKDNGVKKLVVGILLALAGPAFALDPMDEMSAKDAKDTLGTVETFNAGDTEASVSFMYYTTEGEIEYNVTNVQVKLGAYLTDRLMLGIGPAWALNTDGEEEMDLSAEAFCIFNFTLDKTLVPYAKGAYFQRTFDIPGDKSFTDYAYALFGFGIRYFFSDIYAFDTSLSYGYTLVKESHDSIVLVSSGFSLVF